MVVVSLMKEELGQRVVSEIEEALGSFQFQLSDITNEEAWRSIVSKTAGT